MASLTSSNEKSTPLFDEVSDQMVRTLREKNVTGVYIVLHTGEISRTAGGSLPCLYLRDLDPSAPPPSRTTICCSSTRRRRSCAE